jgi:hypothetical protein
MYKALFSVFINYFQKQFGKHIFSEKIIENYFQFCSRKQFLETNRN